MPDFDANEDPATLPGGGDGELPEPAEQQPPAIRRAREIPDGHLDAHGGMQARRFSPSVLSQRTRARLRACNRGWRGSALRARPRRRRLWTLCHGRPPGPPS